MLIRCLCTPLPYVDDVALCGTTRLRTYSSKQPNLLMVVVGVIPDDKNVVNVHPGGYRGTMLINLKNLSTTVISLFNRFRCGFKLLPVKLRPRDGNQSAHLYRKNWKQSTYNFRVNHFCVFVAWGCCPGTFLTAQASHNYVGQLWNR